MKKGRCDGESHVKEQVHFIVKGMCVSSCLCPSDFISNTRTHSHDTELHLSAFDEEFIFNMTISTRMQQSLHEAR